VLCSPHRAERPWQGQTEIAAATSIPSYDPNCYLCPGNERAGHVKNPDYRATFVFDMIMPLFFPLAGIGRFTKRNFFIAHAEPGICRVVCFSPSHDLTLPQMQTSDIRLVVDAWRKSALPGDEGRHQLCTDFRKQGTGDGMQHPHPHGQIWATNMFRKYRQSRRAASMPIFRGHGEDMLGNYLSWKWPAGSGLICRNEHWVARCLFGPSGLLKPCSFLPAGF